MEREKLDEILRKHLLYLQNKDGGERANLSYADLSDVDLSGANLSDADLSYVDLSDANLSDVNLRGVNLRGADLSGADLSGTDLRGADLRGVNLRCTDLSGTDLRCTETDKRYVSISCIGSRKDMTTYCFDDDIIWCGCFTGSLADFVKTVMETHKENPIYLQEYLGFINYIKNLKKGE